MIFQVTEIKYPNEPYGNVGDCYRVKNFFFRQRKKDVLTVNTEGLITTHPIGFLYECVGLEPCTLEDFSDALNQTVFEMDFLSGEYKTNENDN